MTPIGSFCQISVCFEQIGRISDEGVKKSPVELSIAKRRTKLRQNRDEDKMPKEKLIWNE